jgi:hypothetical protein
MLNAAGNKPIAIGECEVLPSSALLAAQPRWTFFMGWAELVFNSNSTANLQTLYAATNVITRDEMPSWGISAPNLAYQRPVTVSSVESSAHAGALAVDDDRSTRWSSAYADNQFITVDLGATYNISRVYLAWEAAYAQSYQLQVSTDNISWTTVRSVQGKASAAPDTHANLSAAARYVRVNCLTRATSYGFSLLELEVYGTATSPLATATGQAQPLVVFPIPTAGSLTVQLPPNWTPEALLTLTDGQGRTVLQQPLPRSTSFVDVSHLAAGIYQLRVASGQQYITRRIVKR